jgi:hypothetical protein
VAVPDAYCKSRTPPRRRHPTDYVRASLGRSCHDERTPPPPPPPPTFACFSSSYVRVFLIANKSLSSSSSKGLGGPEEEEDGRLIFADIYICIYVCVCIYTYMYIVWNSYIYILFIGIRTLLLSVTRGYSDHSPFTTAAILEWRSTLVRAVLSWPAWYHATANWLTS